MKEYTSNSIRNVALVSHSSAGKTMLAEACLHFAGVTTRLGKIEDGTTVSDFDDEESRRGISVYTSVLPVEYKNAKINLLDTPGYTDFVGEMISALRVADSALVLVDAVSGVEVGTEVAWDYCDQFNLPRCVVINKMNRENADFKKALASIENFSDKRMLPIQLPWGEKHDFTGVIDLLSMKAYKGDGSEAVEIPAEYKEEADAGHMTLVEAAAEGTDELMEKYFEVGDLTGDEIQTGLRNAILEGAFVPVFVSAGAAEIGIAPLLNAIVGLLPSPADMPAVEAQGAAGVEELTASDAGPLAMYVWKTTADPFVGKQTFFRVQSGLLTSDIRLWNPAKETEERIGSIYIARGKEMIGIKNIHAGDIGTVPKLNDTATGDTLCDKGHPLILPKPEYPHALYRVAIHPKTQADSTKISPSLTRLCEEDMTLSWMNDPATRQTVLQGMGDQHIDVAIRRAQNKLQVSLETELPKVPYREAIRGEGDARYRHKKQSGGSGQFGEVALRVSPSEEDFEFKNDIFGGSISSSYLPAIEKGIRNTMKDGILAGYPINNVKVSVYDGKEHPVDSKPVAFEIAGRGAFKQACLQAGPILLEPIMNVRVTVPEENMGDVMGDFNSRRGRVQGMETEKGRSVVTAQVPLAEMQRYTTELRSMTGGRGVFTMEFDRYDTVPSHVAEGIIAAAKKEEEEE
ncbi:MAG: elongation factor G [Anaerolineaceae bacterium]|jgi:elongation factor G|nr:elongation factor G [Anaerolineaceae bacterium]